MATARDTVGADLIAAALETRREELIAASLGETRSRIQAYRDADADLLEHVRRHIGDHHDLLCAVLRRGRPALAREFEFVARHAARSPRASRSPSA